MRARSSDNFEVRKEGRRASLVVGLVLGSLLITWENNFPLTRDTACAPTRYALTPGEFFRWVDGIEYLCYQANRHYVKKVGTPSCDSSILDKPLFLHHTVNFYYTVMPRYLVIVAF